MLISACFDCFDYIAYQKLALDMSIEESALFLAGIYANWPKSKYVLQCVDASPVTLSNDPCQCCSTIEAGHRISIKAFNVH